ncbi:MAG: hypothetical protein R3F59_19905 [Myxococcota bacterium]
MRRFEQDERFWEVRTDGPVVRTRFGTVGRRGDVREVERELATPALAAEAAARAVARTVAAGFAEVDPAVHGGPSLAHTPLELPLWEDPSDAAAWGAYAAWLRTQGPQHADRAALAALEADGDRSPRRDALLRQVRERDLTALCEAYDWRPPDRGPEIGQAPRLGYAFGFWSTLEGAVVPALDADAARFLTAVRVRAPDDDGYGPEPAYADALAKLRAAPLPGLRRFELDDTAYQLSWIDLGCFDLFVPCPRLEHVRLVAGDLTLGEVRAPRLVSFTVRTTGLKVQVVEALCAGELPALEVLDLWIGDPGRSDVGVADLALLHRPWPRLRHLGLGNAPLTDALVDVLADSPVLPQLVSLDLAGGTLTRVGAERLVARADRFRHLSLDLEGNLLDEEAAAAVARALPDVGCDDQREVEDDDDDPSYYVSVGE